MLIEFGLPADTTSSKQKFAARTSVSAAQHFGDVPQKMGRMNRIVKRLFGRFLVVGPTIALSGNLTYIRDAATGSWRAEFGCNCGCSLVVLYLASRSLQQCLLPWWPCLAAGVCSHVIRTDGLVEKQARFRRSRCWVLVEGRNAGR